MICVYIHVYYHREKERDREIPRGPITETATTSDKQSIPCPKLSLGLGVPLYPEPQTPFKSPLAVSKGSYKGFFGSSIPGASRDARTAIEQVNVAPIGRYLLGINRVKGSHQDF